MGFETQQAVGLGYKIYLATLTQSGTNPPVPTILINTLGFTPVWGYGSPGFYSCIYLNGFPSGKTAVFIGKNGSGAQGVAAQIGSVSEIDVYTDELDSGTVSYVPANGVLLDTAIQIIVKP